MLTRKLWLNTFDPAGIPLNRLRVAAEMTRPDIDAETGEVILPRPIYGRTLPNGAGELDLWPSERGTQGSAYRVRIYDSYVPEVVLLDETVRTPDANAFLSGIIEGTTPSNPSNASAAAVSAYHSALWASHDPTETVPEPPGDGVLLSARGYAVQAAATVSNTAASASSASDDADATAADRIATGQDRTATGEDRVATGQDRVATGEDRVATGQDRVATGEDRTAAEDAKDLAEAAATQATTEIPELRAILQLHPKYVPLYESGRRDVSIITPAHGLASDSGHIWTAAPYTNPDGVQTDPLLSYMPAVGTIPPYLEASRSSFSPSFSDPREIPASLLGDAISRNDRTYVTRCVYYSMLTSTW